MWCSGEPQEGFWHTAYSNDVLGFVALDDRYPGCLPSIVQCFC